MGCNKQEHDFEVIETEEPQIQLRIQRELWKPLFYNSKSIDGFSN